MSKYMRFDDIVFADRDCLLSALGALGFGPDRVEEGARLPLYGYRGDRRPEVADVVIRRQHVGPTANDIGFARTAAGYVPVISEYDQEHVRGGRFLAQLRAAYGEAAARTIAARVGGTLQRRVEGDRIVLTIRHP